MNIPTVEFNILVTFAHEGVVVNNITESFSHIPVLFVEKM